MVLRAVKTGLTGIPTLLVAMFLLVHPAWAKKVDCQQCNKELTVGNVVHVEIQMDCEGVILSATCSIDTKVLLFPDSGVCYSGSRIIYRY